MKNALMLFFCMNTVMLAFAQESKNEFDGHTWEPPYSLDIPKGWGVERFLIPIEFAPQIPYKGVEDIRFTPGWGNAKTEEYWTYAFLWYLDGAQELNSKIIENNFKNYYEGLIGRNVEPRKIASDKLFPVKTSFKKVKTQAGDVKTFKGTIYMLDYMEQKPMTLYSIVHMKSCTDQAKTFVFTEISPKKYKDAIWQSLNQLWTNFKCNKVSSEK